MTTTDFKAEYEASAYYDVGLPADRDPLLINVDLPWRAKCRVAAALADRRDWYEMQRAEKVARWPQYIREKRLSDVARLTQTDLLNMRNFGRVCLEQVQQVLERHGMPRLRP